MNSGLKRSRVSFPGWEKGNSPSGSSVLGALSQPQKMTQEAKLEKSPCFNGNGGLYSQDQRKNPQMRAEATDGDPICRLHAQSVFQPGELTPLKPKFPTQESWEWYSGIPKPPLVQPLVPPPHKSHSWWWWCGNGCKSCKCYTAGLNPAGVWDNSRKFGNPLWSGGAASLSCFGKGWEEGSDPASN